MSHRNWSDKADKDLFFTILSVKNIGVITGAEWTAIGSHMRTLGYGFTNEGCRQHFQGLRRAQNKAEANGTLDHSPVKADPTLNPITRRPGPGRGRPRRLPTQDGNTATSGEEAGVVAVMLGTEDAIPMPSASEPGTPVTPVNTQPQMMSMQPQMEAHLQPHMDPHLQDPHLQVQMDPQLQAQVQPQLQSQPLLQSQEQAQMQHHIQPQIHQLPPHQAHEQHLHHQPQEQEQHLSQLSGHQPTDQHPQQVKVEEAAEEEEEDNDEEEVVEGDEVEGNGEDEETKHQLQQDQQMQTETVTMSIMGHLHTEGIDFGPDNDPDEDEDEDGHDIKRPRLDANTDPSLEDQAVLNALAAASSSGPTDHYAHNFGYGEA